MSDGHQTNRNAVQGKIVDAYLRLLATKDRLEITTTEVCRLAQVHRSSFYLHFESLNDLSARFLRLCAEQALGEHARRTVWTEEDLIQTCLALVGYIRRRREFFLAMFLEPRMADLERQWMALVSDWFRDEFDEPAYIDDRRLWDLVLEFFTAILGRFLRMALEEKGDLSDRELAQWMLHYQFGGLLKMGKKEKEVVSEPDPLVETVFKEGAQNRKRRRRRSR